MPTGSSLWAIGVFLVFCILFLTSCWFVNIYVWTQNRLKAIWGLRQYPQGRPILELFPSFSFHFFQHIKIECLKIVFFLLISDQYYYLNKLKEYNQSTSNRKLINKSKRNYINLILYILISPIGICFD